MSSTRRHPSKRYYIGKNLQRYLYAESRMMSNWLIHQRQNLEILHVVVQELDKTGLFEVRPKGVQAETVVLIEEPLEDLQNSPFVNLLKINTFIIFYPCKPIYE